MNIALVKSTGKDLDEFENTCIVGLRDVSGSVNQKGNVSFCGTFCVEIKLKSDCDTDSF